MILSGNPLTGEIPWELGRLGQLQTLSLARTYLSGTIPSELGELGNLIKLDLSHTNMGGPIPPELGAIEWLQLDLSYTNVSGPIPPELGRLGSLKTLNLDETGLTGCIPAGLPESTTVKSELRRCTPQE